jgi:hypothetical protein
LLNSQRSFARQRKLLNEREDGTRLLKAVQQVRWETRNLGERRKTVSYACEVPVQIDRRMFALARAIQAAGGLA